MRPTHDGLGGGKAFIEGANNLRKVRRAPRSMAVELAPRRGPARTKKAAVEFNNGRFLSNRSERRATQRARCAPSAPLALACRSRVR